ncbi:MAG: radical SAM protein, partial [Clostridiales bacterium]|nr:radical SAM protein [Clostridiales bacterium]
MRRLTMDFDLAQYLSAGIEQLVKDALRVTLKNPKQSAFFLSFAAASQKAAKRRQEFEQAGEHIPSFLIASITDNCNLHCAGCYAKANRLRVASPELPLAAWERIFDEAEALGVSVILLVGGEPLLRRDVLEAAARRSGILFPVFTNGVLPDDSALRMFERHRNLAPIISMEGDENATDARRGPGVYLRITELMRRLRERGLLFGASVTVTSENLVTVTGSAFLDEL